MLWGRGDRTFAPALAQAVCIAAGSPRCHGSILHSRSSSAIPTDAAQIRVSLFSSCAASHNKILQSPRNRGSD